MAREIKFRIWTGKRMCYVPSDEIPTIELAFVSKGVVANAWSQGGEHIEEVKIESLMQFTGLKDKNGKEIYEGDVVKSIRINHAYDEIDKPGEPKYLDCISSVEYNGHGFWVKDESFGWEGEDLWKWNQMEVIGNIYQNPELLNT